MSKKSIQRSSWGTPIAVDWGKDEKPQQLASVPVEPPRPRPVTETVVIDGNGNTMIADRVTIQNHI